MSNFWKNPIKLELMSIFSRKKSAAQNEKTGAKGQVQSVDPNSRGTISILKDAFAITKTYRPIALPLTILVFLVVWGIGWAIGVATGNLITFAILFFTIAFGVAFFFFTRQANVAAFASIDNQLGAGASILMGIRKGVTTDPAVNVDRSQNMVHRSISRAGIILVAESAPDSNSSLTALKGLLLDEKRKIERFLPDVPVTTIITGSKAKVASDSSIVAFKDLQKKIKKLEKKLSKGQMRELRTRVKAIGGLNMPVPKGPMPGFAGKMGNRNVKMPRR
jgi:Domain of unknown function (DUF4191)